MLGCAMAVRRVCNSTCDANVFEVMQICLGAFVVTLAKRARLQMAQNFYSACEDFPYFGV